MPLAVIALTFDPLLRWGDLTLRVETVAIVAAILVGIVSAGVGILRIWPVAEAGPVEDAGSGSAPGSPARPTPADLLLVAVAALPGAVAGGRLGYALLHLDYYRDRPGALLDPTTGGLELGLAVLGGTLAAAAFVRALGQPVRVWLHVAALPLLATLGLGKLAGVLGGTGQGLPSSGAIATAYPGPGPWGSLDPAAGAWPAQALEGVGALGLVAVLGLVLAVVERRRRRAVRGLPLVAALPDARAFYLVLWAWATLRLVVAFTWRDAAVLGPLRADQLISLALAAGAAFLFVRATRAPSIAVAAGTDGSPVPEPGPGPGPATPPDATPEPPEPAGAPVTPARAPRTRRGRSAAAPRSRARRS